MVNIFHYQDNNIRRLNIKELNQYLQKPEGLVWIDMEDPQEAEEETILISLMDFHPLAIEDCQKGKEEEGHLPKVEDFDDYLFIIFNPIEFILVNDKGKKQWEIKTSQMSAFLSKKILVTHHYKPQRSITYAIQMLSKNPQTLGKGPDYLFHLIIDDIVDSYTPILDNLDEAIDIVEEEVFKTPTQDTMFDILQLKKNIMTIRRVAIYQREMLHRLSRGEFLLITEDEMIYYRNVYDHLVRMSDLADSYRDMVAGLLDAYLSVTSNRLNQVMKVLTIISTIFLPLSFITGFFGMNFRVIPLAEMEWGIGIAALFMGLVAGWMLLIFKRKKWI